MERKVRCHKGAVEKVKVKDELPPGTQGMSRGGRMKINMGVPGCPSGFVPEITPGGTLEVSRRPVSPGQASKIATESRRDDTN